MGWGAIDNAGAAFAALFRFNISGMAKKHSYQYAIYSVFCKCCDTISVNVRGCRVNGNGLC